MRILLLTISLILVGCASEPPVNQEDPNAGRYQIDSDIAPDSPISVKHIEDAHPRYEPKSLSGNKDYTLLGKDYPIVKKPKGFTQEGISSWYGKKFHGHKTSNGEVYDMYSMSAAHKTLPIPSYVKVTNKDNGKTAIVRVNDRGPFHDGRIIDLSFAAATKLDVIKTGTANVKIEYVSVEKPTNPQDWHAIDPNQYHIQMVAVKNEDSAKKAALQLQKQFDAPTNIVKSDSVFRVRLGPFLDRDLADSTLLKAKNSRYSSAFILQEAKK
ncbi:septal ring lytic transglycosylase RlpA family protein [Aliivibrio sp. S4TY2]|uniref:septal ring lytic transglycosylase RlpA family protein n=1 Tax=unclassified Aliivibrio TaxID=2645654 RepID=UPI00237830D9|nr:MULTISPECIES: septal ring lytic transglycosylase RlpA family protein [unclassified Aliivibrio]MDD9157066.1 septal ring lytic transglycosylase RlpA family protein [Aliivibrio sp. S4TY2]MDD9161101.1 septal ring lytic transglycosylase RlpA family protein [Aliivibrio sp. S4TY1]MDD9164978.1 septal ring lytic transglycosylase RlpA family protein [Aliivibrio sp. S4MY2]MDD9169129.1 septal ring lytic transglycosylase RlpA family protein [Aliivibrio sp. S4MY4]MDD9185857.1 septal ring lytic transglyco